MIGNWIYHALGLAGTGPVYAFWSGFGSDIGETAIVVALYHSINCHEKGCWRIGFMHDGYRVCHTHRKSR